MSLLKRNGRGKKERGMRSAGRDNEQARRMKERKQSQLPVPLTFMLCWTHATACLCVYTVYTVCVCPCHNE